MLSARAGAKKSVPQTLEVSAGQFSYRKGVHAGRFCIYSIERRGFRARKGERRYFKLYTLASSAKAMRIAPLLVRTLKGMAPNVFSGRLFLPLLVWLQMA